MVPVTHGPVPDVLQRVVPPPTPASSANSPSRTRMCHGVPLPVMRVMAQLVTDVPLPWSRWRLPICCMTIQTKYELSQGYENRKNAENVQHFRNSTMSQEMLKQYPE